MFHFNRDTSSKQEHRHCSHGIFNGKPVSHTATVNAIDLFVRFNTNLTLVRLTTDIKHLASHPLET